MVKVFSRQSGFCVFAHKHTHTRTHVFVLLKVIFGSYISFNLHMKHYFTKLFTSMDFRHHFSKFLPCKLRRRHTSIPDFNSQAEVSYQRNWEKRKREIAMLLIEERRQTLT